MFTPCGYAGLEGTDDSGRGSPSFVLYPVSSVPSHESFYAELLYDMRQIYQNPATDFAVLHGNGDGGGYCVSMKEYFRVTRSGTYGFLMALPLMMGYEVMTLLSGTQVRVASASWIKQVLNTVSHSHYGFAVGVIIFGTAVMYREREEDLPIRPAYFGCMLGESIILVPIFALTVMFLTVKVTPPATMVAGAKSTAAILQLIGISLGAGVYEEFLFRVCLISFLAWGGVALFPKHKVLVYSIASVFSALVFSGVHYIGPLGDDWSFASFIQRALAGLVLNGIYLSRGFGVAAWTHALYDVVIFMHQP